MYPNNFNLTSLILGADNFYLLKLVFYKNNLKTAANPKICMIQP